MINLAAIHATATSLAEEIDPILEGVTESNYVEALSLSEFLMIHAEDKPNGVLCSLLGSLADAIRDYENQDPELVAMDDPDGGRGALRVLMSEHKLTGCDLPEIGDKTAVSRILSGARELNKGRIDRLSARFGVSPAIFF